MGDSASEYARMSLKQLMDVWTKCGGLPNLNLTKKDLIGLIRNHKLKYVRYTPHLAREIVGAVDTAFESMCLIGCSLTYIGQNELDALLERLILDRDDFMALDPRKRYYAGRGLANYDDESQSSNQANYYNLQRTDPFAAAQEWADYLVDYNISYYT